MIDGAWATKAAGSSAGEAWFGLAWGGEPGRNTESETALHTHWTCPCNNNIDDPKAKNTQEYIQQAVDEHELYPHYWVSGICPISFTAV